MFSSTAAFACVAAVCLAMIWTAPSGMPHPYSGLSVEEISEESFARFPDVPANLTGKFSNNYLAQYAKRMFVGQIHGAESVAVTSNGTLIMVDKFGYVHRALQTGAESDLDCGYTLSTAPPLYIGPGRPLGFHTAQNGTVLFVCDSLKGLIRVDLVTETIAVLSNRVSAPTDSLRDAEINYANDLDVDLDGIIYFSSSTAGAVSLHATGFYDTMRSFLLNMCRGDRSGRLLR